MKIQLTTKQLNDPKYEKLKKRIDEHNAKHMADTKSKIKKEKTMRRKQRKNPNGFNFTAENINKWSNAVGVAPLKTPSADPIDSYFDDYNRLIVTQIALKNGFDHFHWIKAKPVQNAIADMLRCHPSLVTRDTLTHSVPRSHTAYHPFLASLFLETITVKPEFKDTLKKLKVRTNKTIADMQKAMQRKLDVDEDRALIAEMRRTRGDIIQEELWAFDQDENQTGMPFHTLAKKFDVRVQDLHEVCINISLMERDPENTFAYKPTHKAISLGYMRTLNNVKGERTTYPWVTKKGMQHLFETLDQLDMHGLSFTTPAIQYSDKQLDEQSLFN